MVLMYDVDGQFEVTANSITIKLDSRRVTQAWLRRPTALFGGGRQISMMSRRQIRFLMR